MTSALSAFEAATWIKSLYVIKSLLKTTKRKYGKKRNCNINRHYKSRLNGIHSLLRRADAKGSADIIYLICDAYRSFAEQALLLTSRNMSRTEYLII